MPNSIPSQVKLKGKLSPCLVAPVLAVSLSFTCEDPKARGLGSEFLSMFYVGINSMRCTRDFVASCCASILC